MNLNLNFKFLISSFLSSYSPSTLFTKTNSSWITFELIKALQVKTSMLFNLDFANNTILSCFFFLNYWLNFLTPVVIGQIFNSITELVIPIRIPSKEAKAEI